MHCLCMLLAVAMLAEAMFVNAMFALEISGFFGNHPLLKCICPCRRAAFDGYKAGPGEAKALLLTTNKAKLKGARKQAKELGLAINTAKRYLDVLKARADTLKAARNASMASAAAGGGSRRPSSTSGSADAAGGMGIVDGAGVLDAEEYDVLMQIKDLKAQYREQYNELQVAKSEVDYTQVCIFNCCYCCCAQ